VYVCHSHAYSRAGSPGEPYRCACKHTRVYLHTNIIIASATEHPPQPPIRSRVNKRAYCRSKSALDNSGYPCLRRTISADQDFQNLETFPAVKSPKSGIYQRFSPGYMPVNWGPESGKYHTRARDAYARRVGPVTS
jgi:hypothetical protein